MHAINDYLIEDRELSAVEFRICIYMVHADYGRRKNGLVWEGAEAIGDKLGCCRKTVRRTWKKMERFGWLRDTGEKVGRATIWQVEYQTLWNESAEWKREKFERLPAEVARYLESDRGDDSPRTQTRLKVTPDPVEGDTRPDSKMDPSGSQIPRGGHQTRDIRVSCPAKGTPDPTTPPKEAAESTPPKKATMRTVSDADAAHVSNETHAGHFGNGRIRTNPRLDLDHSERMQVQDQGLAPVARPPLARPETPAQRDERLYLISTALKMRAQGILSPGKFSRALEQATDGDLAAVEEMRRIERAQIEELSVG